MKIRRNILNFIKNLYSKAKIYKIYLLIFTILTVGYCYSNSSYIKRRRQLAEYEKNTKSKLFFDTKLEMAKDIKEKGKFLINNNIFNDITVEINKNNKNLKTITLIDYSSYNCSFCRKMRTDIGKVLDWAKNNNIKLTYILRPITNKRNIVLNVFLSCIKQDREKYVEDFFKIDWLNIGDLVEYLTQLSTKNNLMTKQEITTCLNNDEIYRKIIYYQLQSNIAFDTSSTPLLLINGKRYYGYKNYEKIIKILGNYDK